MALLPNPKTFNPGEVLRAADVNEFLRGSYMGSVYYTSSGSFVKGSYPWLRAVNVRVQGAGGGGGGAVASGTNQFTAGDGGAGGGYAESFITDIENMAGTVTVTVGAGGAGGVHTVNNGLTGGNSSFGTAVIGNGGGGGSNRSPQPYGLVLYLAGAAGGGSGTGEFVVGGGEMTALLSQGGSGFSIISGPGSSHLSAQKGQISTTTKVTQAGALYGGGGYGALIDSNETNTTGGAGAAGIVIVDLFS
jgi:hypothetical protein